MYFNLNSPGYGSGEIVKEEEDTVLQKKKQMFQIETPALFSLYLIQSGSCQNNRRNLFLS